jgi:RNA polymerase sigma factor FliA
MEACRAKDGNEDALVREHWDLVTHCVRRLARKDADNDYREDMTGYGLLGLLEAARRFDPDRGFKFRPFAGFRVRGAILDGMREMDWMFRSDRKKAQQGKPEFAMCSFEDLDLMTGDGNIDVLGNLIDDGSPGVDAILIEQERRAIVRSAVDELPEKQRRAVEMHDYSELPMAIIGEVLGVSETRVSQIRTAAIDRLRRRLAA